MIRLATCLAVALAPVAAVGQVLSFPGNAEMVAEETQQAGSVMLPLEPWEDGGFPGLNREGTVTQQAWRIPADGITALQVIRPLRSQLRDAGFEVLFECDTAICGGFDFRFALDVMLPPAMQVDLGDFRYLTALRDDVAVGILASRSRGAGHVQATFVTPSDAIALTDTTAAPLATGVAPPAGTLEAGLATQGRYVLEGLTFETGSARLAEGATPSLDALADYLAANPGQRIALVGHTDAEGALEGNIALSKRRAAAVLERLVGDYQVPRGQLDAQGMGYLAPRASNQTEAGRSLNRRVEVIVSSTPD